MFLSMHNWMRAEPIETTIRRLSKFGFESIEISGEPEKYNTKEVLKLLKENKINCWGSVTLMFEGRDLIHANPQIRENSVKYIKGIVTEEEWQWAVEGLREIYAHSEPLGVTLAIEPLNRFETNFLNRHDQALLLAKETGPHCGIALDAFHINIEEADLYKAVSNAGPRLADFHVADNNRMAPGQGDYNWAKLIKTLDEAGYKYALTLEFVAPIDRTPANPYKNALGTSDKELTPEQLKFIQDHGSGVLSEEFYSWLVGESAKTLRKAMKKAGVEETRVPKQVKISRRARVN